MNKVELMGRLTRNPELKNVGPNGDTPMARYTLAIDRRYKKGEESEADFVPCVTFGKSAEFAMKHLKKGTKIVVCGRIQIGSYTNNEEKKVYTMNVVVDEHFFTERRDPKADPEVDADAEEFMNVPEGTELPFD